MKRIAVLVYPGTNSEEETLQLLRDCGGNAEIVHWSRSETLRDYDAYVLPGGFAYEDRIRVGAVAARDEMTAAVVEGTKKGKLAFGICNGAQILLEAGLAPGLGAERSPEAAFTHNAPARHFLCTLVHVRLAIEPSRCALTASLPKGAVLPAWAAHADGRLAARSDELAAIAAGGHVAFIYTNAHGTLDAVAPPNGSALGCAALTNGEGNVLAIMPHVERVHPRSAGAPLFSSFVRAVELA